jgi:GAF domain-containing protein
MASKRGVSHYRKPEDLRETLQEIYAAALEAMSGLLDTRNMYIALYDEDSGLIEFPLAYGPGQQGADDEEFEGRPWDPRHLGERQGLTEWVIRHKKPLLIENDFEAWIEAHDEIEAFPMGTKCWLGAPMLLRDRVIGVIGLQNFEREGVFDRNHRDLLMTIASQAATAIENARLFSRAVQAERSEALQQKQIADERQYRLKILQEISGRMAEAGLDPDEVLALVAQAANDITRSDLTSIYRYDQETAHFTGGVLVRQRGRVEPVEPNNLPNPEGLAAKIAETQEPVFVDDAQKDRQATDFARRHGLKAFAALPLTFVGRQGMQTTVAVLFVNFEQLHTFSEDEREILRHLANQAAVAIAYAGAQASALAKEQLAALGTAAATLQHRLGNTINVILPAVMRLRYRVGEEPTNIDILDTIERNALFATEVIRRMQAPLREEPFVRTNFNSLLREAIRTCLADNDRFPNVQLATNLTDLTGRQASPSATPLPLIAITVDLDDRLPETYARGGQLTEVFRVLVENAIKAIYPQAGSVKIITKLESDRLRQYVRISVSDSGKGIDDKTRANLFKQPVPRKEFGQGAGLGLWLSNIIVRSHQGNVHLHWTKLNEGSTFLVNLPIFTNDPRLSTTQGGE